MTNIGMVEITSLGSTKEQQFKTIAKNLRVIEIQILTKEEKFNINNLVKSDNPLDDLQNYKKSIKEIYIMMVRFLLSKEYIENGEARKITRKTITMFENKIAEIK